MSAELGLAVIATVDLCFTYGIRLVKTYKEIQVADTNVRERIISIEALWIKISRQLDFLKQIWDHLDDEYRELQNRIIPILARKLETAITYFSKVEKKYNYTTKVLGPLERFKYVIFVKKSLEQAILELNSWQEIFNPSWYHVIATYQNSRLIDSELEKGSTQSSTLSTAHHIRTTLQEDPNSHTSIFLPDDRLASAQRTRIPFSHSYLVTNLGPNLPPCILDIAEPGPNTDVQILTKDVRTLATRLHRSNPLDLKLLKCFGVVKVYELHNKQRVKAFNFIFPIPEQLHTPRCLRQHLQSPDRWYSLTDKLRLAKQLAVAVSSVHTLGFVHKNIRPETILIMEDTQTSLSALFLVGFKSFRTAEGRTVRRGDLSLENNIYLHPDRQWLHPTVDFTMQHDIYSLGVCLLEIGLEETFVIYNENDRESMPGIISNRIPVLPNSDSLKDALLELAREELPRRMGDKYTNIVINCMTCTDKDNEDFGDETEFYDQDGVRIGVAYIEKILLQLNDINF